MVNPEPQREPFREPVDGYAPEIRPRTPSAERGEVRGPFRGTGAAARPRRTTTKAVISLALAIAGLFIVPIIFPVLAIAFGWAALSDLRRNPDLGGKGLAVAGVVIGAIALIIGIIGVVARESYSLLTIYLY